MGADALTDIDPTEVWKIPVEDDEVRGGIGLALDKTTGSVACHLDVIAFNV
jgi:hypothetical protein